jgi:adenylate cyclase
MIHILRHGKTLCGIESGQWTTGEKWVSFEDAENIHKADCPKCKAGPKPPKNVEIERRFIVLTDKLPEPLPKGRLISQGYLSIDPVVRVRISENNAWITVKGPGMVEREEYEYQVPWQEAEKMLGLCRCSLIKTRRKLPYGQHTWDVDEFHGPLEGLWLAEVELSNKYEGYEPPPWINREVSDDRRYTNASLARAGKIPT